MSTRPPAERPRGNDDGPRAVGRGRGVTGRARRTAAPGPTKPEAPTNSRSRRSLKGITLGIIIVR